MGASPRLERAQGYPFSKKEMRFILSYMINDIVSHTPNFGPDDVNFESDSIVVLYAASRAILSDSIESNLKFSTPYLYKDRATLKWVGFPFDESIYEGLTAQLPIRILQGEQQVLRELDICKYPQWGFVFDVPVIYEINKNLWYLRQDFSFPDIQKEEGYNDNCLCFITDSSYELVRADNGLLYFRSVSRPMTLPVEDLYESTLRERIYCRP